MLADTKLNPANKETKQIVMRINRAEYLGNEETALKHHYEQIALNTKVDIKTFDNLLPVVRRYNIIKM